jgi:hypothetical protein
MPKFLHASGFSRSLPLSFLLLLGDLDLDFDLLLPPPVIFGEAGLGDGLLLLLLALGLRDLERGLRDLGGLGERSLEGERRRGGGDGEGMAAEGLKKSSGSLQWAASSQRRRRPRIAGER